MTEAVEPLELSEPGFDLTGQSSNLGKSPAITNSPHSEAPSKAVQGSQDTAFPLCTDDEVEGLCAYFNSKAKKGGKMDSEGYPTYEGYRNRWDYFDYLDHTISLCHPVDLYLSIMSVIEPEQGAQQKAQAETARKRRIQKQIELLSDPNFVPLDPLHSDADPNSGKIEKWNSPLYSIPSEEVLIQGIRLNYEELFTMAEKFVNQTPWLLRRLHAIMRHYISSILRTRDMIARHRVVLDLAFDVRTHKPQLEEKTAAQQASGRLGNRAQRLEIIKLRNRINDNMKRVTEFLEDAKKLANHVDDMHYIREKALFVQEDLGSLVRLHEGQLTPNLVERFYLEKRAARQEGTTGTEYKIEPEFYPFPDAMQFQCTGQGTERSERSELAAHMPRGMEAPKNPQPMPAAEASASK